MDDILDNIGLPYSQHQLPCTSPRGSSAPADADIMVSLKENHHPTADYVRELRTKLPAEFPGVTFYFLPADIVTQILNFGLPAPIDVQIEGADIEGNRAVADRILEPAAPRSGRRRPAHPADLRLPKVSHRSRPHQSR